MKVAVLGDEETVRGLALAGVAAWPDPPAGPRESLVRRAAEDGVGLVLIGRRPETEFAERVRELRGRDRPPVALRIPGAGEAEERR